MASSVEQTNVSPRQIVPILPYFRLHLVLDDRDWNCPSRIDIDRGDAGYDFGRRMIDLTDDRGVAVYYTNPR